MESPVSRLRNELRLGKLFASGLAAVTLVLASCGGGTSTAPVVPVSVSITSASNQTNVAPGQTVQFTAMVQNSGNSAVTWQVNSIAGATPP